MDGFGSPASYLTLEPGTPVFSSERRRVGVVTHVLAAPEIDVFDGIVVSVHDEARFVDADLVDEIHSRGVLISVSENDIADLPKPSEQPGSIEVGPDDLVPDSAGDAMRAKLPRAGKRVSGAE